MKVLNAPFVKDYIRMCEAAFAQGWHERNGGNFTYRIADKEVAAIIDELTFDGKWQPIGAEVPGLAGEYFMTTGSGKFFQNVASRPEESIGIVQLDEKGQNYKICWGLKGGAKPTSELPSHLMNHEVKKKLDPAYRIIYHCHPVNLIALTFVLPLRSESFTRELWEMMTECPVVFPAGIGVVPWMVPGGVEIAIETSKLMEEHDAVIWAHHGLFCAGPDFDTVFGLAHTIEKAAETLVKVRSMTDHKAQTITPDEFRKLAVAFGVELPEKYLYEHF